MLLHKNTFISLRAAKSQLSAQRRRLMLHEMTGKGWDSHGQQNHFSKLDLEQNKMGASAAALGRVGSWKNEEFMLKNQ